MGDNTVHNQTFLIRLDSDLHQGIRKARLKKAEENDGEIMPVAALIRGYIRRGLVKDGFLTQEAEDAKTKRDVL